MAYREKLAWLSLIAMTVTFGPYFLLAAGPSTAGGATLPATHLLLPFGAAALAQAVLLGVGRWFLRRQSPLDARTPLDERDRVIDRRSITLAYYALVIGMILVGVVMPFSTAGWGIVNAGLLAIVIAELVHYASVVTSYRLQS